METDDFADDKNIQRMRREQEAYLKMIDDCVLSVQSGLGLVESGHKNLKKFWLVKSLDTPFILGSYSNKDTDNNIHVSVIEYHSSVSAGKVRSSSTDPYFFGLLTLKKEYPVTLIHRETLKEKIADLITGADLDFKGKSKFSRRFYVVTENKRKLEDLLYAADLNALAAFPNAEIELNGKLCLFRNSRKPVSPEVAVEFIELAKTLKSVFL